ncbi:MAG: hypothetical protein Q4Q03_03420 [Bowdeniella nasicola]|nr:hypothetical protein [Bowdeniella nasicola]
MQQDVPGIFYSTKRPGDPWQVTVIDPIAGWEAGYQVAKGKADLGAIYSRHTLVGRLREAYPVGARDVEIMVDTTDPEALWAATHYLLEHDPDCRRIVLATPAGDIPAIDFGERAGYRYVVDVEITEGSEDVELSLLVAEPEWVLKEPRAIETRAGH